MFKPRRYLPVLLVGTVLAATPACASGISYGQRYPIGDRDDRVYYDRGFREGRDAGHSRAPAPPHKITGLTVVMVASLGGCRAQPRSIRRQLPARNICRRCGYAHILVRTGLGIISGIGCHRQEIADPDDIAGLN